MASELGKVYVSPDHSTGKFRVMPLKPDGTVNLNVYAQARTLSFNTFEDAVKYAKGLVSHYGGTVESDTRGKSMNSRPGAPDTFAVEDRFYFGKKNGLGKRVFGGWTMDFSVYKMLIGRIEAAAKKLPLVGVSESDALINESRGVIETVLSTLKSHRTSSGLPYPMETDKIKSLIQSAIKKLPMRKLETLYNKAVDRYYNFGDAPQRRKNPAAEKAYQVLSKIGDQTMALENLVKYLETVP